MASKRNHKMESLPALLTLVLSMYRLLVISLHGPEKFSLVHITIALEKLIENYLQ